MIVWKCPNCKKETAYSQSNPHRPFCSERCKAIDLGAWASESYAIPLEPAEGSLEDSTHAFEEDLGVPDETATKSSTDEDLH